MKTPTTLKAGLAALAATLATPAIAQNMSAEEWAEWQDAQNETVSAERMMGGDVSNGFNFMGDVRDLVLNPAGTQIQYILYEVPQPWSFYGNEDGFVAWDNIRVERGIASGIDLTIDDEESLYAKDQLRLTRSQAENRLVSRIVGGDMRFADGSVREIQDILFDPDTGMLTDYIVELDEDSLFDEDTRRIPASMVSLDPDGLWIVAQPVTYDWEIWVL